MQFKFVRGNYPRMSSASDVSSVTTVDNQHFLRHERRDLSGTGSPYNRIEEPNTTSSSTASSPYDVQGVFTWNGVFFGTATVELTIKAQVSPPMPSTAPVLRHKTSPKSSTLRDLRAKHSRQALRARRSDEQLQELYETQTLSYLESPTMANTPISA